MPSTLEAGEDVAAERRRDRLPSRTVEDELALYAAALAIVGSPRGGWPARYRRELQLTRAHLAPIGSRSLLAASFGRESFPGHETVSLESARLRLLVSPVHAAYATRWVELAEVPDGA
jgi:hypothetical protein